MGAVSNGPAEQQPREPTDISTARAAQQHMTNDGALVRRQQQPQRHRDERVENRSTAPSTLANAIAWVVLYFHTCVHHMGSCAAQLPCKQPRQLSTREHAATCEPVHPAAGRLHAFACNIILCGLSCIACGAKIHPTLPAPRLAGGGGGARKNNHG